MDFTRTRKQSFSTTLLFMIDLLTKSLSIEIEDFVGHLRNGRNLTGGRILYQKCVRAISKKNKPGSLYTIVGVHDKFPFIQHFE